MQKSILIIFIFLNLSGCAPSSTVDKIGGQTMGTTYTIKSQGGQVDQAQIEQRLKQISQIFSSWDKNSELSKLNNQPLHKPILLSSELSKVLSESILIHQQTQGFFDPGLGRLIDIWGFGAPEVHEKPSRKIIAQALLNASISQITLKADKLTKKADVQLNLSAIAKGYALDEVAKLLTAQGAERFMLEIGGEVKAKGSWNIGIEAPVGQAPIKIELIDSSIATSGNYRQHFIWKGEHYAHILDPHTGLPVASDLFSASVIHPSNLRADAYATAMMAMGSNKAAKLARQLKLKTVLILKPCTRPCQTKNIIKIGL